MKPSSEPASPALRVLIVGVGAVGQIYGYHLAKGGARVTFYVRERHRAEAERGFTVVHLRGRRRREVSSFAGVDVVSSAAEVAARRFDQVYLAIPSTGLAGAWLAELLAVVGEATLVGLTPAAGDRERLLAAGAHADRLVAGFISLVSYPAPLPDEPASTPTGTTVWFPPASPSLFSGPPAGVAAVVAALRAGGLPARATADVIRQGAYASSVFMVYLLALEAAGWSLRELRGGALLAHASEAARQTLAVLAPSFGPAPLPMKLLLRPWLLRLASRLAPRLVPFPLESYVKLHFTKVGAQTRLIVKGTIERGRAAGLPVHELEGLLAVVPA
jgi:Ketopantoate reductase PanE/ApbA